MIRSIRWWLSVGIMSMGVSCSAAPDDRSPVNDPLVHCEDRTDRISILTFNLHAVTAKSGKKLAGLIDYVHRERFDFALFQEVFEETTRSRLQAGMSPEVYPTVVPRIDYEAFPDSLFQDSGLFIASRYPRVDLSAIEFAEGMSVSSGVVHTVLRKQVSLSIDFVANKSVMGSLHRLPGGASIFLFCAHTQAMGTTGHKRRQFRQIRDFIQDATQAVLAAGLVRSESDLIVLLTGDLNVDAYDEQDATAMLDALGSPRDLHQEANPTKREYTMVIELLGVYRRLDYILAYDALGPRSFRKVGVRSVNVTHVRNHAGTAVSDHRALKACITTGR
jgi:endonuclease/exonuclease/phosphatase family metal-dependent hydrolase